MLLARIPFFRNWALDESPPAGFKGYLGTCVFAAVPDEDVAVSVGRRSRGERTWARRHSRRPARWDASAARIGLPPRPVPRRLWLGLFVGGRAVRVWLCAAAGLLVIAGWLRLDVIRDMRLGPGAEGVARAAVLWPVGLPLLALALLRPFVLHVLQISKVLRLLREGEVVPSIPVALSLPGELDITFSRGEVNGQPFVTVTRAPASREGRQMFLVDGLRRRVVAWDLLPVVPEVAEDGTMRAPKNGNPLPWVVGPVAVVIALILTLAA